MKVGVLLQEYEKRYYTLQQIADSMNRPRSTINEWRKLFSEYIPSVGEGRQRRYKRESLNIFETIARLKESNETNDQIRDYLSQMVDDITIRVDESEETPPPLLRQMYDSYSEILEQNEDLKTELQSVKQEQQNSKEREEELLRKIDELTTSMQSLSNKDLIENDGNLLTKNDDTITNENEEIFEEKENMKNEEIKQTGDKEEKKSFWKKLFR